MAVLGIACGYVREWAPIPAGGATKAPTCEVLIEDPLGWYSRQPARLGDSLARSQLSFRIGVLDFIGENHGRRDLAMEPATLPISSADAPDALKLLSDLNAANGTRHFAAPADDKAQWYAYTTRNRLYKLGAAADVTLDAGSDHVTGFNGWRLNDDPVVNAQRATINTISFPPVLTQVWSYPSVPLTISAALTLFADFTDYVRAPILDETDGGGITIVMTPFGHSAKLDISGSGTITKLAIKGTPIDRAPTVTVTASDATSQTAYGVRAGSDLSGSLVGAQASAQGIVDHIVWRFAQPLRRPAMDLAVTTDAVASLMALDLYDLVAVTVSQLDVAARIFEIVGLSGEAVIAADGPTVLYTLTWQLQEQKLLDAPFFIIGTSLLAGADVLAP